MNPIDPILIAWGRQDNYTPISNDHPLPVTFAEGVTIGSVDVAGMYNATLPTVADGKATSLQIDNKGRLIISIGDSTVGVPVAGVPGATPIAVQLGKDKDGNDLVFGLNIPSTILTGLLNTFCGGVYSSVLPTGVNGQYIPLQVGQDGSLLVNTGFYNTAPVETAKSVLTTKTQLVAANNNRTGFIAQNLGPYPAVVKCSAGTPAYDGTSYYVAVGGEYPWEKMGKPNTEINALSLGTAATTFFLCEAS